MVMLNKKLLKKRKIVAVSSVRVERKDERLR